jgi:hypothetical protein
MLPSARITVLFLSIFLFFSADVFSQRTRTAIPQKHRCGSQFLLEESYKKNPQLKTLVANERARLTQSIQQGSSISQRNNNTTLTVSVVVHIVLPADIINNVTDAQVQSQIDVLNTDFAGLNADSTRIPTAFKSRFGKGKIRFCLAKRTPDGQSTNGIVRVSSTIKSNPGLTDPVKYTSFGGSDAWDPKTYLNIWVCDDQTSSFLGYTFTPTLPLSAVPLQERGFVNQYQCFGKSGTAQAPYNLGRTAVHEIGHFFNLEHIWGPSNCDGSDNCNDDDGVGDTPTQEKCNYGAPAASTVLTDNCTSQSPGIMWMNYMDYVDDRAMVMYTPQQYVRMEATFNNVSWMQNLANTDACTVAQSFERDVRLMGINNPVTSYNSSFLYACSNNFQPVIKVRNTGTATVNTLRIEAKINNGTPFITNWSGTIATGAEADITLNNLPVSNGTNTNLVIDITQVNGLTDLNPANNTYTGPGVIFPVVLNLPLSEGFEQVGFPPVNWRLLNPDNDTAWTRTIDAAKTGVASMFFDNYNLEANNLYDWMISPLIPARSKDSIFVRFDVAAATYRKPSAIDDVFTDTLEVLVSSDCGVTYNKLYNKAGLDLVTTGDVATQNYFIPTANQWRRDSVFIGYYDNSAPEYIQVAFKNIVNYENNIYIDNIQIYNRPRVFPTSVSDIAGGSFRYVRAFPNPFKDQIVIEKSERISQVPYRMLNVYGQQIMSGMLKDQKQIIDAGRLSSGVYFFQVKDEIIKLIKR